MPIVSPYAALLALLFVALSVRTLSMRRRLRIAIGDAGDERMLRAMRVHANFAEYVPFTLLLIYLAEVSGAPPMIVHTLCVAVTVARAVHAFGVSQINERFVYRIFGMSLTFAAIILAAVWLAARAMGVA